MAFNSVEKRNEQLAKENKKLRHYGMKLRAIDKHRNNMSSFFNPLVVLVLHLIFI